MKITLVGTGFVGLTSSAVYAHFGNEVVGLGHDERKTELLNQGVISFYEPKLSELLNEALRSNKLSFTTDYAQAIPRAELVIICVGTPSDSEGDVDLSALEASLKSMAPHLAENTIVAIKSTVPPGTLDYATQILSAAGAPASLRFASLPEFLKEGTAVDDTLYPDRIVIGATDDQTFHQLSELHAPFDAPIVHVSPNTAQLAKYAANNYLANRIVFINEMANVASAVGADIEELIQAMGLDKRIGDHYWYPGLGYGGSCFPKDVKGLAKIASKHQLSNNLFSKIDQLNSRRPEEILARIDAQIDGFQGKKVAVLGLSFKPNTDDQRVSPALATIPYLLKQGAEIIAYDPMVTQIADKNITESGHYTQVKTIEEAITDADIILTLVEWPQIAGFDFTQKVTPGTVFIDTRNQFNPQKLKTAGYRYFGIGRGEC